VRRRRLGGHPPHRRPGQLGRAGRIPHVLAAGAPQHHRRVDGVLARTIPLTLSPTQHPRLQGARTPGPTPQLDQHPTRVQRTVSLPRRHPDHRPTRPSRAALRRPDRHHQRRRHHPARLQPARPPDQDRSPHQPQGDHPTQGLRSHHQPQNQLGTVTHHLKPIRHPSSETRHTKRTTKRISGHTRPRHEALPPRVLDPLTSATYGPT
jgi:hypothetical protein